MRLLQLGHGTEFKLTRDFVSGKSPPYAILSHTWGPDSDEVTFQNLKDGTGKDKSGHKKLKFCAEQARSDGLEYLWVDSCCIDKSNNSELSEAINSMFRWYHKSTRCYVYLSDVSIAGDKLNGEQSECPWEHAFRVSRWFTRGWTLQELIAPVSVEFFTWEGRRLGNKRSLENWIHEISRIPIGALRGTPLSLFSVDERLKWAETRQTTRDEDWAYSLLGIFGVFMPLIYGEGKENAIRRLKKEIDGSLKHQVNIHSLLTDDTTGGGSRANKQGASHWVVPFDRNKDFVGRESILARLLDIVPPRVDNDACQQTAIVGLGGVGKTQIALEVAFRVRELHKDCSVFWVHAIDAASFERAYRNIGRYLNVQGVEENEQDVKVLVKIALSQSQYRWLLVIDNADDAELLLRTGIAGALPLFDYLPSSHRGSILYTMRNDSVIRELDIPRSGVVRVTEMNRSEAVEMLHRHLCPSRSGDLSSITLLLDFLADLPLAIKQASAYMAMTGITPTKYLEHCHASNQRLIELLSKNFADRGRYKTSENAITTTWLISFRQISRDNPLAARYLKFMSFLAETDISTCLLPPGDELEVEQAIGMLQSYAFISKRPDQNSYDIHRLVAMAMRNWLAAKGKFKFHVTTVIQRLDHAFPFPQYKQRTAWEKHLPHVQRALELRRISTDKMAVIRLLFNVAEGNAKLGKYIQAEELFQETMVLQTESQGAEHPDTLTSANNLATALRNQGRYAMADALYRRTLEARMRTLGIEHVDTLRSRNGLTNTLIDQGMYTEAEIMYRETLLLQTKKLGPRHTDTLRSNVHLANTLSSLGKYAEAEAMLRETFALQIEVLGAQDSDTCATMYNYSIALSSQGKYADAERLFRETLVVQSNYLGTKHPDTVRTKNGLAITLYSRGKFAEAEALHRETLAVWTKALNAEHPNVHWSRNGLANALGSQGKYAKAEEMYRETLALQTKALGFDHPETLTSRNGLAVALFSQGKDTEAEETYRETLALRAKTLGAEHPDSLKSRNGLANVLSSQGKHAEAEKLHRDTLRLQVELLGPEHPDALWSRNSLANTLHSQGKYAEAEVIYRETLLLRTKVLGLEHPSTLWTRHGLASALCGQGKLIEAEEMHWETLALQTKTLGAEHPETLMSRSGLTVTLSSREMVIQAEAIHQETLMLQTKAFGAENPETCRTRSGLARIVYNQGKYAEAEAIYREILVIQLKYLSPEHLDVLTTRNKLALALGYQKKHAEAEIMHWETLATCTTAFGARHPSTMKSRDSLAVALCMQGKHAEAKTIYRETLGIRALTGDIPHNKNDDIDWLRSQLSFLDEAFSHQGQHGEAEYIYREISSQWKWVEAEIHSQFRPHHGHGAAARSPLPKSVQSDVSDQNATNPIPAAWRDMIDYLEGYHTNDNLRNRGRFHRGLGLRFKKS